MKEPAGLDPRQLEALRHRVERSAFHNWVGLQMHDLGDGRAELRLELQPQHFNAQGMVHGGIITVLADTCIGLALRSKLRSGLTHRTAQLNVHFLQKGEGDRLVGVGNCLHSGQRMGYGEAEIHDGAGNMIARAVATFVILPAPGAF